MKRIEKKIKSILLHVFVLLMIFSCTELHDTSYSEVLTEGFEPTEEDIARIIGSAYGGWRITLLFWNGYWRVQENCADEIVTPPRPNGWVDGGIFQRIHRHAWTNSDDIVNQTWSRAYGAIADCNNIIFQVKTDKLPLEDLKAATLAELRALRASYYYILCDMYGNVPIDTLYDVEEGYIPEQNTRQEVFDFIVGELTNALPYLSEDRTKFYYGRFNVWAARTLLAKMYLNAEVYTGTPMWNECLAQCNLIIDSAGYNLESNQKNVFITENENSTEIIFGIALDELYTDDWNAFDIHMQTLEPANQGTYNLTQTPWGGMCAIPQFINTFDPADKRLTKNFIFGQQYKSNGDSLFCTLGSGLPLAYTNEVNPIEEVSEEYFGYRFGKFEYALGSTNVLSNDYPLFRYTDVLMMKAECLLRTGDADGAAEIVTKVRTRAFDDLAKAEVTGAQLMEGSSYEYGLRDEGYLGTTNEGGADIQYGRFLDELGWEFNQEGRRRQDMIRFGVFTTKSFLSHQAQPDNHTALYPIPTSAIETNTNLIQNPGY